MIYRFWMNADYLDNTSVVILDKSNIKEICYLDYKKGWFKLAFNEGKPIDTSLIPQLIFYYNSVNGWEFYETVINAFNLLTIRSDVKEALVENGVTNVQYIPIIIENIDNGEQNTDYYVVNFLTQLDAVNLEHSQFHYNPKYDSYSFWGDHIYFDSNAIAKVDMFVDAKASMSVFVSDKVRKIFQENHWHTMNFTKLGLV